MATLVYISIFFIAVIAILYQLELNHDPLLASASVTFMRDREDSFKYAANIPHYEKWTLMISKAEEVNKSHLSMGKTFKLYSEIPIFGRQEIPTKVVVYKPYHRLDLQTHAKLLEMRVSMNFTDVRGENLPYTRLDCSIHSKRRGLLYYSTIVQGLRFVLRSQLRGSLLNMKLFLQT